ncbi:MAG: DUF4157 domain-containing protein [Anaerolineales bacterium]|nr:DUF4157 domain-containing protein [Anaerolineales bacterium]
MLNAYPLPKEIPACAARLLARPEWFADPGIVHRTKLAKARGVARWLSSPRFAGTEIAAITLGHTIYFRQIEAYTPHTPCGLALLAHEIKHIEQVERHGLLSFYWRYWLDYRKHGYGEALPFEMEANRFERLVRVQLKNEFALNAGRTP